MSSPHRIEHSAVKRGSACAVAYVAACFAFVLCGCSSAPTQPEAPAESKAPAPAASTPSESARTTPLPDASGATPAPGGATPPPAPVQIPRRAQADFDHAIGHRDDVFDRAQSVLEGIAARRCDRSLEYPRDLLCGNLAVVRPVGRRDPEDIAQAVVADVPSLGEAAHDVSARIELDQPLGDAGQQNGIGRGKRASRRIAQLRLAADHNDLRRAFVLVAARAGRQRHRCQQDRAKVTPHHHARLAASLHSASVWIYRADCFTGVRQCRLRERFLHWPRGMGSGAAAGPMSRNCPTRSRLKRSHTKQGQSLLKGPSLSQSAADG